MDRSKLLVTLGVLLLVCISTNAGSAQDSTGQQMVRVKGGGFVVFKTTTEPATTQEFSYSNAETDSNIVHRVFIDKSGTFYFGYDLEVEPVFETREFRTRVLPLSPEFEQRLQARKGFKAKPLGSNSQMSPISESSRTETLKDGDAVALDVLVNPETHVKIVDIISVSFESIGLRQEPASDAPARDFSLGDVELKVSGYRLLINGSLVTGIKPTGGCAGPLIWFYLPGQGRFIFSLTPHDGYDFQKTGSIEQNKIIFNVGGDRYEWVSNEPIVGSGGNWNLWVLHDASYVSEFSQPDDASGSSVFVGSEKGIDLPSVQAKRNNSGLEASEKFGAPSTEKAGSRRYPGVSTAIATGNTVVNSAHKLLHLIFGAADRMENLLPKR